MGLVCIHVAECFVLPRVDGVVALTEGTFKGYLQVSGGQLAVYVSGGQGDHHRSLRIL